MSVDPEQLPDECETYPTVVIDAGGVKVGVSEPMVLTVNAPTGEGLLGQSYLIVPEPAAGVPLTTRLPPQALLVAAAWEDMTTDGRFSWSEAATAAPTKTTPTIITSKGLM